MARRDRSRNGAPYALEESDYQRVFELASAGWTEAEIALDLGIDERTWKYAKQNGRDDRLLVALRKGRSRERQDLHGALKARAMDVNNKLGAASGMFLLKARHGYKEYESAPSEQRIKVELQLPAALSREQYEAIQRLKPGNADAKALPEKAETVDAEVVE